MGLIFRLVKIAVMLALFVVLLVFAIGNSGLVSIKFLTFERTAPLVLVLFVFLIIGVVVGLLALTGALFRQRRQIQQLKRDIRLQAQIKPQEKTKAEVDPLIAMPPG
jgi:lipopolysaccharide assembly protein A